jgi:uncharacterized membrane protein
MAKGQQQTKYAAVGRDKHMLEQNTIIDDSLLPPAEELAKLKEIDANVIKWIMERTEKEQDARIEFNKGKMKLANKELGLTKTSLWLAFVLVFSVIVTSAIFVSLDHVITGSILGGIGIILIVQSFLKFGRNEKQ